MDEVFGELESKPFQVSENTLVMMDEAVKNMKAGTVSEVIDLLSLEKDKIRPV